MTAMARKATTPNHQMTSAGAAGGGGANGGGDGPAGTAVSEPEADSPPPPRPDAGDTLGLPPVLGGPSTTPWRENALTRAAELATLANWLRETDRDAASTRIWQAIDVHLDEARQAAHEGGRTGFWERLRSWITGAAIERAESNIDAAETDLLRLAPLHLYKDSCRASSPAPDSICPPEIPGVSASSSSLARSPNAISSPRNAARS